MLTSKHTLRDQKYNEIDERINPDMLIIR